MKKVFLFASFGSFFFIILLLAAVGGGGQTATAPVTAFATEEEAYAYQYIGAELGVPWDIALLVDGIRAHAEEKKDLSDYNPMLTSLQFCILQEEEFIAVEIPATPAPTATPEPPASPAPTATPEPSVSPAPSATPAPTSVPRPSRSPKPELTPRPSYAPILFASKRRALGRKAHGEPTMTGTAVTPAPSAAPEASATPETSAPPVATPEPEIIWVSNKVTTYTGTAEILAYIDVQDIDYRDATTVVNKINDTAAAKSTDKTKYEITLLVNPDFESVLLKLIGLSESNTKSVLELYDSNYLAALYGYMSVFGDIVLPDIVQGNVSRADLAAVAISLINHPYLLGGKSSTVGAPTGPLDCSGYVDWVYMQCFGVTIGNGTVPEGVAVSGTAIQWYASEEVKASELRVGDLGFMKDPALMKAGQINHVGIYLGSYNGNTYWIHCGGRAYGTEASPSGRVGISVVSGMNNFNPVDGSEFEPAMKGCRFRFFRRPRFTFTDD